MSSTRTYVRHITVKYEKFNNVDQIINDAIASETNEGAVFKTINSAIDGGNALFVLVFERAS